MAIAVKKVQYLTIMTCSILGWTVFPVSTTAQPQPNCKAPQTQLEMNLCADQQAKAADQVLNQVYRKVRGKYKGTAQDNQLVNAQLAWIKFRDAECQFASDRFKGGSIAPMAYAKCLGRLTKQRTEALQSYLEEGSI